jgi:uncharacterized protein YbcI
MSTAVEGQLTAAISNAVVHCTREYTGRGPTKARTTIGNEIIVTRLEDTLTKGERSLADSGKGDMVLDIRRCFQMTMREELVGEIEKLTGRKVIAFMSDNHIEPDMAVEIFVLESSSSDGNGSGPDDAASAEPARSVVHESRRR